MKTFSCFKRVRVQELKTIYKVVREVFVQVSRNAPSKSLKMSEVLTTTADVFNAGILDKGKSQPRCGVNKGTLLALLSPTS